MKIEDLKGCFANITDDDLLRDNGNLYAENKELQQRIDKAINRISLIRMDRDTSIETHKVLDEILNALRGSDKE